MFEKIKEWFNQDRLGDLEKQVRAIAEAKIELGEELEKTQTQLREYQEKEQEENDRRSSAVPWVEIKSANFNETTGIQIELDWNDAFVSYLRDNGITGATEELIVQKWLAFLYDDLVVRIEEASTKDSITGSKASDGEFV